MSMQFSFMQRPPKDFPPIDLSESLDGDRDVAGPKCALIARSFLELRKTTAINYRVRSSVIGTIASANAAPI